ncbi:hypothetical protein LTR70_001716 [Exophiala xenobiotica]|uniref:4-coumarate-CoA ligase n=1 Tax=Lithohypha guttulata TaxID=1690604 RepID=A0ABR0KHL1_9EURO|nr:hypothetical protein LTR24_002608 [Lithohypha guttulata]KAK5327241.1 hypothetical protein LTR70_001716 [Exophiala xenobiotica]
MPFHSPHPKLNIPKCNLLSYVFADGRAKEESPLWMDAANPSNSLSMSEMHLLVKRFALGLDDMAVPIGSAVMIFSPNHIYVPMVYLATAGSKRAFTGANPVYTVSEVSYQMKIVDAAVVLIHPTLLDTGLKAAKEAGIPMSSIFSFSDEPKKSIQGIRDWREILSPAIEADDWRWDPLKGEAAEQTVACINFSSGTTGLPKGVCISHANLIANASQTIHIKFDQTGRSEKDPGSETWLAFLPLYHAYSQLWTINIACRLRYKVYVMQKFVFEDFLRYVQDYKVDAIQAVPPILIMLTKRPEVKKYDISSLKHILVGAAPTSPELQRKVTQKFKLKVGQGWGMTETTCAGIMVPFAEEDDGSGTIGVLLPNTDAKLVDDEGNEITVEGERGELCVRGPQMLMGYWKNETATKESKEPDGFFHSGDVAIWRRDKLGRQRLWIVDRKKELIKVKGLQVAPAELEAVLLESPDVADAAVVGIRFEEDGEEWPRGYVVLQDDKKGQVTEEDVQKFVAGKVAKHKWLEGGVKFVDEVPKLPSGKIMRKVMKDTAKNDAEEMRTNGKVKARL